NSQFNPAADMNGDGTNDNSDLLLLYPRLIAAGVDQATLAAYNQLLGPPLIGFTMNQGDALTLFVNQPGTNTPPLSFSWDINNQGTFGDVTGANPTLTWDQLVGYGVSDPGTYPLTARVPDGTNTVDFATTLTVQGPSFPTGGVDRLAAEQMTIFLPATPISPAGVGVFDFRSQQDPAQNQVITGTIATWEDLPPSLSQRFLDVTGNGYELTPWVNEWLPLWDEPFWAPSMAGALSRAATTR